MRKLGLLVMPLMAISLLASCNNDKPATKEYTLSIDLVNCKIGGKSTTYTKKYTEGAIIDAVTVTPDDAYALTENSVPSSYKQYWSKTGDQGEWTFSNLKMDGNHSLTINATDTVTLTIELNNCTIGGSTTYSKVYPVDSTISPVTVTPNDGLALTSDSVSGEYQKYWSNDDGWKLSGLVMDQNYTITINAGYMLTISASDVTISSNLIIPNQKYEGTISINQESIDSKILPVTLTSVILGDASSTDITDKCTYKVEDENKVSSFEIPADSTTANIQVNLTTKDIATAKWYDYANWWDYCSKDGTAKATTDDVGKEVNVTVYDLVHKVRLIDIEHKEPGETAETPAQAHCTFEFANVITKPNEMVSTSWDASNNLKFHESILHNLLNNTSQDNCIFNALPAGLQGAIKEVNKKVEETTSYTAKSYKAKLFPLAYEEIYGVTVQASEGLYYKYYADHTDDYTCRIKTAVGGGVVRYWLRTPSPADLLAHNYAWHTTDAGRPFSNYVSTSYAVAPAFCI